jgi:arginyl-tRNA synthetase
MGARLALVKAARAVMARGLATLGAAPVDEM